MREKKLSKTDIMILMESILSEEKDISAKDNSEGAYLGDAYFYAWKRLEKSIKEM